MGPSLEHRVQDTAADGMSAPEHRPTVLSRAREYLRSARAAYYGNPRVNLHANSIIASVAAAGGVAIVSSRLEHYSVPAGEIAVWGVVTKEAIVWGIPSLLHPHANGRAFRDEDGFDYAAAAKSVAHFHTSGMASGLLFTAIGAGGQWLLQRWGVDAGLAGLISYGVAILPSRVVHDVIAERTGLYDKLRD